LRKLEITVQDPIVSTWTRPALAPDGHAMAYGASGRLWVRRLDRLEPLELRGSVQGERPFWSADSTQVAFSARRKLWKAGAAGEEATVVCDLPGTGRIIGGVWRPDNVIVFSLWFGGLYQVPADGGDAKVLHEDRAVIDFHEPALLPDGRTLVLVPHTAVANLSDIAVLRDGRRTTILPAQPRSQVDMPRYSASGHLVYTRQGANEGIWAIPFSPDSLGVRGEPFNIVTGDWVADVAADGTLVYTVGGVPYEMRLVDRGGALQNTLGPFRGHLMQPALSPDGGRVLVAGSDSSTTAQNDRRLWLYDIASGRRERFPAVPEQTNDATPEWSPDGRRVVYVENRRNPPMIVWRGIGDGSMPQVLTSGTERPSFSPDGRLVAFARDGDQTGSDVWMVPFTPGAQQATATVLLDGKANERSPRFSPDGRFIAYDSDESGRPEVYLRRYPLTAERWVVSTGGGSSPLWHRKGTELFYRSPDAAIMSVPVKLGLSPTVGEPRELFSEAGVGADLGREFDVSADGQRFVIIARSAGTSARITVVQNWFREFRK
jgi:serine/threonine-protein kinase